MVADLSGGCGKYSRQEEGVGTIKGTDSGAGGRAAGVSHWAGSGGERRETRATRRVAMSFGEMRTLPKVPLVSGGGAGGIKSLPPASMLCAAPAGYVCGKTQGPKLEGDVEPG